MHSTTSSALCTSQRSGPSKCRVTCSPSSHLAKQHWGVRGCTGSAAPPRCRHGRMHRIHIQECIPCRYLLDKLHGKGDSPGTDLRPWAAARTARLASHDTHPHTLPHPARLAGLARFQHALNGVGSGMGRSPVHPPRGCELFGNLSWWPAPIAHVRRPGHGWGRPATA